MSCAWSASKLGDFYPRSPCGERQHQRKRKGETQQFLSTLSLRRATAVHDAKIDKHDNFYPRSPCGERHDTSSLMQCQAKFLSTLSLRRATNANLRRHRSNHHFYPRSPCGERRWLRCWQLAARDISIHALLAESDSVCSS